MQGVFFRDSCRREAIGHNVRGWVRNRSDGAVEAVFEGPEPAVDALCAWSRTGPAHARVERVKVTDEEPRGEVDFYVRS